MLYYLNVEKSNDEVCPSQEGISESAAPAVSGVFQAISAFRFGADRMKAPSPLVRSGRPRYRSQSVEGSLRFFGIRVVPRGFCASS